MSKIEELQAASTEAEQELSKQSGLLSYLRLELGLTGEALDARSYSDLKARLEIQERRTETASRVACKKRLELDEARSAEAVKLQREQAEAAVDSTLGRLRETQAAISAKRTEAQRLAGELPQLEFKASQLLFELDRRKTEAARLGASA